MRKEIKRVYRKRKIRGREINEQCNEEMKLIVYEIKGRERLQSTKGR